jgi:hypothetical protein
MVVGSILSGMINGLLWRTARIAGARSFMLPLLRFRAKVLAAH